MADVFREVDEDLRREQLKRLWDRFAPYIIGLAVLIVLGVSGYKLVEYWQRSQAAASGDRFIAALDLADKGNTADAAKALEALAAEGSGSYPVLARFAIASQKADTGDRTGAVADFDAIAARSDIAPEVRNLARLRAALILVDTAPMAEINRRVGDLAAVGNPWRQNAREVLALSAFHEGDLATAKNYFQQISADQDALTDMRQRAQVMLALIAAKEGPPPAPPAASTAAAPSAPASAPAAPATVQAAPAAPTAPETVPTAPAALDAAPAAPSAPAPGPAAPPAADATPAGSPPPASSTGAAPAGSAAPTSPDAAPASASPAPAASPAPEAATTAPSAPASSAPAPAEAPPTASAAPASPDATPAAPPSASPDAAPAAPASP